jgi:hypothetical protein
LDYDDLRLSFKQEYFNINLTYNLKIILILINYQYLKLIQKYFYQMFDSFILIDLAIYSILFPIENIEYLA